MINALMIHLSKYSLTFFQKKSSLLLKPYKNHDFLFYSLKEIFQIKQNTKILFIIPENEKSYFETRFNEVLNSFSKDKKPVPSYEFIEVNSKEKHQMTQSNCQYHPLFMIWQDHYGAWYPPFFDKLCKHYSIQNAIVYNLESFWFLSLQDIQFLINKLGQKPYLISFQDSEGCLIGINHKHMISEYSKLKKKMSSFNQSLFNNYKSLIQMIDPGYKNINIIQSRIESKSNFIPLYYLTNSSNQTNDHLNNWFQELKSNSIAYSLKFNKTYSLLKPYLNLFKNNDQKTFINQLNDIHSKAHCLSIITMRDYKLSNNLLKTIADHKDTPIWILSTPKNIDIDHGTLSKLIETIKSCVLGILYLEIDFKLMDDNLLNDFYVNGIDIIVLRLDDYSCLKDKEHFLNKIMPFINLRNKLNKKLMIKIQYDETHTHQILEFYTLFNFITDGLSIDSSSLENSSFKAYCESNNQSSTSIIHINELGNTLKNSLQFPKYKPVQFNGSQKNDHAIKNFTEYHFEKAKNHYIQKDYTSSLNIIEHILKYNPCHVEAWRLIDQIEDDIE